MSNVPLKLVYVTPALYMAGGVERVLTLKANYFAEHFGYDITIILTEGKDKPLFYPLSDKVKVINLDIGFEKLWNCSLLKKILIYLPKQRRYKKLLTRELMRLHPDVTISSLRREINFINNIPDGSKKIGELHLPRPYFRYLGENACEKVFSKLWIRLIISKLKRLDAFVLLSDCARMSWPELANTMVIPNPLPFQKQTDNTAMEKRIIVVGRYSHEKGYDMLLKAWSMLQDDFIDWRLETFGEGDRTLYEEILDDLHIHRERCILHGRTEDVQVEYAKSSFAVCSSRFEGFGLVIIEAMSCGLPVVSFDCPLGPRSFIEDGKNGILVENGNVIQLSAAIRKMMEDEDFRRKMAIQAKKNSKWYQMENIAEQWKALFAQLMSDRNHSETTLR